MTTRCRCGPEVGTQSQFRKKKAPVTYRYDSSLSPALDWDCGNGAREMGEWPLAVVKRAATLAPPHVLPETAEFKGADGSVLASVQSPAEAVETKGFDHLGDVKAAAAERWVSAVNADGAFGRWSYATARKVDEVRKPLDEQG